MEKNKKARCDLSWIFVSVRNVLKTGQHFDLKSANSVKGFYISWIDFIQIYGSNKMHVNESILL